MTSATPPAATSTYYVAATNRLVSDWALYDNAGNMTAFKNPNGLSTGQWSAAYDGENKQRYYCGGTIATCGAANKTAEYVYDGEGNRVQKLTSSSTTTYVYDAFGRLAAEYTAGGPSEEAGTFYRTTDHLGSTRLVTDAEGEIVSRRDFFPFGEQIDANSSSGRNGIAGYNEQMGFPQLFTGKERDDESGLDYFGARYYSGALGRFTSVDPGNADATASDPRSWNGYAYTRNSPLSYVDPNGLETRIRLVARPIPASKDYGHVYIRYEDTETGATRISSAFPSRKYPGGGTEAVFNRPYDGITLDAQDNSLSQTNEKLDEENAVEVADVTIDADIDAVQDTLEGFNDLVNEAGIVYKPRTENSNAYGGAAFERLTGEKPTNATGLKLPGLDTPLAIPPVNVQRVRDEDKETDER